MHLAAQDGAGSAAAATERMFFALRCSHTCSKSDLASKEESADCEEIEVVDLKGVGLDGVTASDGVRWVNELGGPPQSGHGSTSQAAMHSALPCSSSTACFTQYHTKPWTLNPEPKPPKPLNPLN